MEEILPDISSIPTPFSPATCLKRGHCLVSTSKDRSPSPHKLYYELHGDSSPNAIKILFIMGLNNSCFAWEKQIRYFGRLEGYQVLVFDNRGVGNSDTPKGAYKTSEMAKDAVELMDHLGWKGDRSVAIVGVSMGGMISQELALLVPERIHTLLLTSTKSGSKTFDPPSLIALNMFGRLLTGMVKNPEQAIALVIETLFPKKWLEERPGGVNGNGETRREITQRELMERFRIGKLQTLGGRLGQMAAVLTHKVSDKSLAKIGNDIPRVAIIQGDDDNLIYYKRGEELHSAIPGSDFKLVKEAGHALPSQIPEEYNKWIVENVEIGLEKSRK